MTPLWAILTYVDPTLGHFEPILSYVDRILSHFKPFDSRWALLRTVPTRIPPVASFYSHAVLSIPIHTQRARVPPAGKSRARTVSSYRFLAIFTFLVHFHIALWECFWPFFRYFWDLLGFSGDPRDLFRQFWGNFGLFDHC